MPKTQTVVCPDMDGNHHLATVDELKWRPSVYGIVIKDDAVLLSPQYNGYDLPGGAVELGETIEEALLREIKEETGVDAANPKLLTVQDCFFKLPFKGEGSFVQSILMYYQCDYVGGELSTDGFTEDEKKYTRPPMWIPLKDFDVTMAHGKLASTYDWRDLVRQLAKER